MNQPQSIGERHQVVADLQAARAELDKHGWQQGCIQDDRGRLCAMGAVALATGVLHKDAASADDWTRHHGAANALRLHIPIEFDEVAEYNDDTQTRESDIYALFDKALADFGGLA